MQPLYKKTDTGKIQQWEIELSGDSYRTISGQLNGKMVTSGWTVAKPKNVGKSNERDAEQQAEFEMLAKVKKQRDEGYVDTIEEAENAEFTFSPSLAQEYNKHKAKVTFPCYVQPKLDGVRSSISGALGMRSRENNPQLSAPHIFKILESIFRLFPDMVLDGELYNHNLKDDFDKIISLARKTKPTAKDLEESEEKLQFYVFDVFFGDTPNMSFSERREALKGLIEGIHSSVVLTPTFKIKDQEALDAAYAVHNLQGYEGQMIRLNNVPYEHKRSHNLLKRKEFNDQEYKIVRIIEGLGNRSKMAGMVECVMEDGRLFKAGLFGGVEKYLHMWHNQDEYIGKLATIRYQNLTPKGFPRFPVMRAVRDYE